MNVTWEQIRWVLFAALIIYSVFEVVRAWRASRGLLRRQRPLISSWAPEQMLASEEAWRTGHRAMIAGHVVNLVLAVVFSAVALAGMSWWLILSLLAITATGVLTKHCEARAAAAVTDHHSPDPS